MSETSGAAANDAADTNTIDTRHTTYRFESARAEESPRRRRVRARRPRPPAQQHTHTHIHVPSALLVLAGFLAGLYAQPWLEWYQAPAPVEPVPQLAPRANLTRAYPLWRAPHNTTSELMSARSHWFPARELEDILRAHLELEPRRVLLCMHHLELARDAPPYRMCVLHLKASAQYVALGNPALLGWSEERDPYTEYSVAAGRAPGERARYRQIVLEWHDPFQKAQMHALFRGLEAAALQLALEEMQ